MITLFLGQTIMPSPFGPCSYPSTPLSVQALQMMLPSKLPCLWTSRVHTPAQFQTRTASSTKLKAANPAMTTPC